MAKSPKTSWPAEKIEFRPLASLLAYARNARLHSDEQVAQIAASIKEFGWVVPIVIDEDGVIICGHGRVLASAMLHISDVPCIVARDWTEAQKRAYRLLDNQIPNNSTWDHELLKVELGELAKMDFDLKLLGFDDLQLVQFMAQKGGDPEETPEPPEDPVSRTGDLWLLGDHRLRCGDATSKTDVDACLGGAKPHLMVVDPPYGVDYDPMWRNIVKRQDGSLVGAKATGVVSSDDQVDWHKAWMLFHGSVIYCWHAGRFASYVQSSLLEAGFEIRSQIIWVKHQFVIGRGDYHWQHEPCWYAVRKGHKGFWSGDRTQSTVWEIAAPSGWAQVTEGPDAHSIHSTQKPIECMKRPIENNSKVGDYVYDPFVGSSTTLIAAEMVKRKCLAIEVNPAYVDVGCRRWMKFANKLAILESTGQTFDEVAKERSNQDAQGDRGDAVQSQKSGRSRAKPALSV